jgi:NIMA (never in mitosis gene a)-related kinase
VQKGDRNHLYIVMNYTSAGDLEQLLFRRVNILTLFPEDYILKLFVSLAFAFQATHSKNILHRDLKAKNIFLIDDHHPVIGGFGLSKVLETKTQFATSVLGAHYYVPPEICQQKECNYKADVWSLGVILYEICALKKPFDTSKTLADLLHLICFQLHAPIPLFTVLS